MDPNVPRPAATSRPRVLTGSPHVSPSKKNRTDPDIPPSQRVKEHPDEGLFDSMGVLMCNFCSKQVAVKASTVAAHLESPLHKEMKADAKKRKVIQTTMGRNFLTHIASKPAEEPTPSGSSLPVEHVTYRITVLKAFLKSGTPLNRMEHFRSLLEDGHFSLTSPSHLCK